MSAYCKKKEEAHGDAAVYVKTKVNKNEIVYATMKCTIRN